MMDFVFQIGGSIGMDFSLGGSAPQPAPEASGTPYGFPAISIAECAPAVTPYGLLPLSVSHGFGGGMTGTNGSAATSKSLAPYAINQTAKLLAIIMHRSAITFSGDGYSMLAATPAAPTLNQQVTIYQKSVTAGDDSGSLSVSQTVNERLEIALAMIVGANVTLTPVDNLVLSSMPYTPTAKTGKRRLYIVSSELASTDGSTLAITVSAAGLNMESLESQRLSIWYDWQPDIDVTPTFSYYDGNYTEDRAVFMSFDVTGDF